jgi:arylformamidase
MTIHDISLMIREDMVSWPTQPRFERRYLSHQDNGDRATVTHFCISAHTGTHVDGQNHFLPGGKPGVDALDLNILVGLAQVIDVGQADSLTAQVFEANSIPAGTERLLVKTQNSARWARDDMYFDESYVAVTADGARWLVEHGIRLIGVDYLSVAPYSDLTTPHQILLGANVHIVEGLNLSDVEPGAYQFVCLPLKIADCDGAPARAILISS